MTPIPEAAVEAAATAMLTPQMRRILHAAGLEYELGQDGLMAQFARLGLEAAAALARPDGAVAELVEARAKLALYRDIFAEITAKAVGQVDPADDDPERIRSYVVPVGPIHRAAGKLGFQMFDGERHLQDANESLAVAVKKLEEEMVERTIPEIVEAIRRRELLAAELRYKASPAPDGAVEAAVLAEQWKTIDSAPKDGTVFLAWPCVLADETVCAKTRWYVHPSVQGWITDEINCGDYEFEPTHWQPLPPAPRSASPKPGRWE